jgi:acetyl esterase/lipase
VASPQLLKLFPNTIIILAEHDILRDEGIKFGKILGERYVPVDVLVYNSTSYGFFGRSQHPLGDVALSKASELLRKISGIYPEEHFIEDEEFNDLPPFPGYQGPLDGDEL